MSAGVECREIWCSSRSRRSLGRAGTRVHRRTLTRHTAVLQVKESQCQRGPPYTIQVPACCTWGLLPGEKLPPSQHHHAEHRFAVLAMRSSFAFVKQLGETITRLCRQTGSQVPGFGSQPACLSVYPHNTASSFDQARMCNFGFGLVPGQV